MATRIANYKPNRRLYPWSDWIDGDGWRVRPGVDFDCTTKSFCGALRVYACRNGYRVSASIKSITEKGQPAEVVEFKFTKRRRAVKKRT